MSDASVELEIKNLKGLHARAAAAFVKCIADLDAEVMVEKDGQEVDGSSILGLMMLAASKGSRIKVKASGNEAEQAVKNISDLVNSLFGEEQ
ncbi:MAG: HPr family phosphocarrier protein [Alphaproteobacteria bacterium]|nr:HPr family phosphocarrier protein [Alphaproteobacteria bacterium]MDY4688982.1 HPr family phosphocarrier protein [Alphaproteobacteria bacterium]